MFFHHTKFFREFEILMSQCINFIIGVKTGCFVWLSVSCWRIGPFVCILYFLNSLFHKRTCISFSHITKSPYGIILYVMEWVSFFNFHEFKGLNIYLLMIYLQSKLDIINLFGFIIVYNLIHVYRKCIIIIEMIFICDTMFRFFEMICWLQWCTEVRRLLSFWSSMDAHL